MAKAPPPTGGFSLPGGSKRIRVGDREVSADDINRLRWQTGVGIALVRLRKHQMPLYEAILATPQFRTRPIVCSRRFGKTMTVLACCEEIARQKIGSIHGEPVIIRVAFPGKGQGNNVLIPNWNIVLDTCPLDLRPKEIRDGVWQWPNGSELYVIGTDDSDQREKHRGGMAHWIFIDEAGSHKEFEYLIGSILSPQLDTTGGRMVMITTPPLSMDHGFVRQWRAGEGAGLSMVRTVFQNTSYTREQLRAICREKNLGYEEPRIERILDVGEALKSGDATPTWEREYLCRMVADSSMRATPRFNEYTHTRDFGTVHGGRHYVFLDPAHAHDNYAAILASFDKRDGKLYVEDEWLDRRQATDNIVTALRAKEKRLWGEHAEVRRYDNDPRGGQQRADMQQRNYSVALGPKSNGPEAEANALDIAIAEGRIVIHPRCKQLIKELTNGLMEVSESGKRADFMRSKDMGHLDALSALAMGIRCVNWAERGPAVELDEATMFFQRAVQQLQNESRSPAVRAVRSIFSGARR